MAPRWFVALSLEINKISYAHFFAAATAYAGVLYAMGLYYSALVFFFTMVFVLGITGFLKLTTRVERRADCMVDMPYKNRAFPSGHSAAAAFVGTMVPYTIPFYSPVGLYLFSALLGVFVLTVALSRLALRAHTLFQVIAGIAIGVAVPLLAIYFIDPPLVDWLLLSF